jgi:hypothetical protein
MEVQFRELTAKCGAKIKVDEDIYEQFKHKTLTITKDGYPQTRGICFHKIVIGGTKKGLKIDHINNDKLDARLSNLRYVPAWLNVHNRKVTNKTGYRGVDAQPDGFYRAKIKRKHIGLYKTPEMAAYAYDLYCKTYEPDAILNNIEKPEGWTDDGFLVSKNQPSPYGKFIYKDKNKFYFKNQYKKKKILKGFYTLEEAIAFRDEYMAGIQKLIDDEEKAYYDQPILKDDEGIAYIMSCCKSKTPIKILIDEDRWYELNKYKWYSREGYAFAVMKDKKYKPMLMHRYLMNVTDEEQLVDHINGNRSDNRLSNLRIVNATQNARNRQQYRKNKYRGILEQKSGWIVLVDKDRYGTFSSEIEAAAAYNVIIKSKYGDHAYLNPVEYDTTNLVIKMIEKNTYKTPYIKLYTGTKFYRNKWSSTIIFKNVSYYLGEYQTEEEAAIAYNIAALEIYGRSYNKLNETLLGKIIELKDIARKNIDKALLTK